jgi:hypothetical protein
MDIHLVSNVLNKIAAQHYAASGQECADILALSKYLQAEAPRRQPLSVDAASELALFRSYLQLLSCYHGFPLVLEEEVPTGTPGPLPAGLMQGVTRAVLQQAGIATHALRAVRVQLRESGWGLVLCWAGAEDEIAESNGETDGQAQALCRSLQLLAPGEWRLHLNGTAWSVAWQQAVRASQGLSEKKPSR